MAREKITFQGLPARICWLGYGERVKAGIRFNEMVANGEVKAPIVIGRDHLDSGSVASPNRRPRRCVTAATPSPIGRRQRARERHRRRDVGQPASRRRRRHRLQYARGSGDRRGWQRRRVPAVGARVDEFDPGMGVDGTPTRAIPKQRTLRANTGSKYRC